MIANKTKYSLLAFRLSYLLLPFQLFNVVVDTSETASKLMKSGRLARRTTFLPLNKMTSNSITDIQLRAARSAVANGHNMVHRAVDLIEYSNELAPAINYIFGAVLVCSDIEVANKVSVSNIQKYC